MIPEEGKHLAEVDFPIVKVSAYSAREKAHSYGLACRSTPVGDPSATEVGRIHRPEGTEIVAPNVHRVIPNRRDCCRLYVVRRCGAEPKLTAVKSPAPHAWEPVREVQHQTYAIGAVSVPVMGTDHV